MSDPHPLEVTIETAIDGVHAEDFYRLYLDAFDPLQTLAAARQVLHRDGFMEDMQDPRVFEYVGWSSAPADRGGHHDQPSGDGAVDQSGVLQRALSRACRTQKPSTTWASRWCTRRATPRGLWSR